MDKMKMESVDMTAQNIEKIGGLFPNCITESVGEDGKLKKAINFDMLRQMLSGDVLEGDEAYEFTWVGKKASIVEVNKPIRKTLRPCVDKSVNWNTTENLYIEGDNLEVLKLLQESYLGKIKMIYIDPPYNTGNDFIYNDDFKMTGDEYADESGEIDSNGNRLFKNTDSNGRFHSDWCSMMYSRILLARNLLSDNGVLFISIDDNEVDNLRKLCSEIFGADNFVADLIWQKKFSRSNDATYFSTMHDHILCYCKKSILSSIEGWKIGLLPRGDEVPAGYSNPDNDPRGVWTSVILSAKSGSSSLLYEITTPSGRKVSPPSGRYWSCSKETFEKWKNEGRIWFGANGDGTPRKKTFLSEVQAGLRPNTILFHEEAGHNQEAKQETKALFDGVGVFDGPKPVRLLKLLSTIADLKDGDILVLSGSIPSSISSKIYKQLSENVKANVEIVLDTRGNLLQDNIHNNLFVKPNIHELREMFNEKLETKAEIVEKCKFFLDRGVKNVILSRGGEGALLVNKDFVLEASVPKGQLINSIGAGDSMVAGFTAGFVKGLSPEDSFRLAVASGSATAYSYGLAEKDLVNKLYDEIEISKETF